MAGTGGCVGNDLSSGCGGGPSGEEGLTFSFADLTDFPDAAKKFRRLCGPLEREKNSTK